MASRCCGSRLSLPNQYDTKTPRASLLVCGRQGAALFFRAVRRPSRDSPGTASRHESKRSVGSKMSLEKFQILAKEKFRKFLRSSRPLDSAFRTSAKVNVNVTPGEDKPQAVPKDRFHFGTSGATPRSHPRIAPTFSAATANSEFIRDATPQLDRHSSHAAPGCNRRRPLSRSKSRPRPQRSADRLR